jgi:hypothetical protein
MARQFGHEKVHLDDALRLVKQLGTVSSGELVAVLMDEYRCSRRAAEDALAVLRRGRWLDSIDRAASVAAGVDASLFDGSRRYYRLSERGDALLKHLKADPLLRSARKLFTSCPSPKVLRRREAWIAHHGSAEAVLAHLERTLLSSQRNHNIPGAH